MNKVLLSLLALCALSLVTTEIAASKGEMKKEQGRTTCNKCHREMGNEAHHCQCAHEVCVQPVQALKHAPMQKVCDNKDRCPENTTARTNKHGQLECIEVRAEEIRHRPICDTTCSWACPEGYTEEAMTPGHKMADVHDEHHTAKSSRRNVRAAKRAAASTNVAE